MSQFFPHDFKRVERFTKLATSSFAAPSVGSFHGFLRIASLVFYCGTTLLMKEREKPGKFLLPHGMILLELREFCIFMEIIPKAFRIKAPLESWHYQIMTVGL